MPIAEVVEGREHYGRYTLSQTELKCYTSSKGSELVETITSQVHLLDLLKRYFRMELPAGTDLTAKRVTFACGLEKLSELLSVPPFAEKDILFQGAALKFSAPVPVPVAAPAALLPQSDSVPSVSMKLRPAE